MNPDPNTSYPTYFNDRSTTAPITSPLVGSIQRQAASTNINTNGSAGILAEIEKEFNFLPHVIDVLQHIKDPNSNEHQLARLVYDLNKKFQTSSALLDQLPGTDLTPQQQQELYSSYEEELRKKSELINKYQSLKVLKYLPPSADKTMEEVVAPSSSNGSEQRIASNDGGVADSSASSHQMEEG